MVLFVLQLERLRKATIWIFELVHLNRKKTNIQTTFKLRT